MIVILCSQLRLIDCKIPLKDSHQYQKITGFMPVYVRFVPGIFRWAPGGFPEVFPVFPGFSAENMACSLAKLSGNAWNKDLDHSVWPMCNRRFLAPLPRSCPPNRVNLMNTQMQAIIESKQAMRRQLAALPFSEKVVLLQKLRDRSLAIAASPLRRQPSSQPCPRDGGGMKRLSRFVTAEVCHGLGVER